MTARDPIRILHTLEPELGWHFVSPEIRGMLGGGATYAQSRARAEHLVRVHLAGHTGSHDQAGRTSETVRFAHFVDEQAASTQSLPE